LQGFIADAESALKAGDSRNAVNDVNLYYDFQSDMRGYASDALQVVNDIGAFGVVANQEIIDAVGQQAYSARLPEIVVDLASTDLATIVAQGDIPTENEIADYHHDVYASLDIDPEIGHAEVERAVDRGDRLGVVRRPIGLAHPHAAEPDRRHFQALPAEFPFGQHVRVPRGGRFPRRRAGSIPCRPTTADVGWLRAGSGEERPPKAGSIAPGWPGSRSVLAGMRLNRRVPQRPLTLPLKPASFSPGVPFDPKFQLSCVP